MSDHEHDWTMDYYHSYCRICGITRPMQDAAALAAQRCQRNTERQRELRQCMDTMLTIVAEHQPIRPSALWPLMIAAAPDIYDHQLIQTAMWQLHTEHKLELDLKLQLWVIGGD